MLERSKHFIVLHRKSGRSFSELQKLNLYYQGQRRLLLGIRGGLLHIGAKNPPIKTHCYDALTAVGAALDSLQNEYERDYGALLQHAPEDL